MFCYSNYHDEPAYEEWNPWEDEACMEAYRIEVVIPCMKEPWFIEEQQDGIPLEESLNFVWKDFENWSNDWAIYQKERQYD